ncbi:DNA-directed RNA polymerase I subunit RPA43 [Phymastichus coffea]|uniref:DNA-directed RNA polymerase I subunit RPA43 n=1 Tax=Phymastichus coffea TaxID=108790 RepID=UPI00273C5A19|nr:DNA-directed RNA polymerase I subunit RPA43 [Phymastichus coffea]
MNPKTKSGIHWTNLELRGLLEDEDSCVYLERTKKHLGLHPVHLNDLNSSLREILSEKLNFYDPELNGLVLAYRNPKILSPYGEILYDTCYIHIDIEADFYVFRPEIGRSLKGYVNRKSTNHIGILVHKAFNVSIPRPDEDELNEKNWPGHRVLVGQEIRFIPEDVDFKSRLPYIRGLINEEDYLNGCKLFNEQIAANYESEFQEITRRSFSQDNSSKTIVKNENNHIVFNSDSEIEVDPDSGSERKSSIKKLTISSNDTSSIDSPLKKNKRKSTPARELGTTTENLDVKDAPERLTKRKHNNPSETDDERTQKSNIKNLSHNDTADYFSETERIIDSHKKKHKKRTKNPLDFDTEDERNHKAEIRNIINNLSQDSIDINQKSPKMSKKTKRKHENGETSKKDLANQLTQIDDLYVTKKPEIKTIRNNKCMDTEDELWYKSTIDKSLTQADDLETSKSKKKRKRNFLDEIPEDTEDERNYKSALKKFIETNNLIPEESPKKRKKIQNESELCEDTEDEKRYKHILKNLDFQVPAIPKKKHKKMMAVNEDPLMDTENEKQHKSYLKELIESMENNNAEVSEDSVKIKKEKKSRKNSIVNGDIHEMNGILDVVVKSEEEQETKKKLKKKEKSDREENVCEEVR